MFNALKKRLKEVLQKASAIVKEEAKEEAPQKLIETSAIPELPEKKVHAEIKHSVTVEMLTEKEELEAEKLFNKTEESTEKKAKKSLFGGLAQKITEKKLSEGEVEKILKELRTALLENDVALDVAEKLSDEVKRALAGKSIRRGEVEKIIKESLKTSMLDVLKQEKIDIGALIKDKPLLVVFFGFNGVGKCVSGDTLIPISDGQIVPIKQLYEISRTTVDEKQIEGGYFVEKPIEVFSVNPLTLKIKKIKAERIWKLKKDKLLGITLENGQEVKVTPEHPFYILNPGGISMKRADEISKDDYVMVPKCIEVVPKNLTKFEILKLINDRKLFINSKNFVAETYRLLENKFGTLRKSYESILDCKVAWNTFRYSWLTTGILPSSIIVKMAENDEEFRLLIEKSVFGIQFGKSRPIPMPELDEEFYSWLGLFYSEGHLEPQYVDFTNTEDFMLSEFIEKTKSIFGINPKIITDKRNLKVKRAIAANKTLSYFLRAFLLVPPKKKSTFMKLPEWILKTSDNNLACFLKSYWEGDGTVSTNSRVLEAATASETFAKQISLILLRFGIMASMAKRKIKGKYYHRINIVGKSDIRLFCQKIGFLGAKKQRKLENLLLLPEQFERKELIPRQSEYIRHLRNSSGILQQDMANSLKIGASLLSQYENKKYEVSIPLERIREISQILSSAFLSMLAAADVRWLRVRNVEEVSESDEWVYDFTVPLYHNFVANNFIVHNTTTIAKIASLYKKYRPVIAAGDTFRAASIEQLEEHVKRLGVDIVKHKYGADSAAVIFDAMKHAAAIGSKLVLADTAGRSHSNVNLMDELKKVVRVNKPDLKVLVLDSITGNDIVDQSKLFDEAVGVDAIILTKADVYEKGGAALSASHTIKKPILFLGTGQDYDDLIEFKPEEIVKNLMG
ncbi:MAG: signal recognition particle receptor subunit alpha [Candidatus Aenigmarchaeota archaeon]|nr:signal recognition particle receptor subunit alpha [Candidatus Aenigmarchaeota archaeon]